MNKDRVIIGMVLAIIVALAMSAYVYHAFQQASTVKPVVTQQIVVARVPLELGTRLTAADVQTIPWPANTLVPGILTRTEDAVGRAVITPLVANEMILESKLALREIGR